MKSYIMYTYHNVPETKNKFASSLFTFSEPVTRILQILIEIVLLKYIFESLCCDMLEIYKNILYE